MSASLHICIRTKFPPCILPTHPDFPSFSALFLSPAFLFSYFPNTQISLHLPSNPIPSIPFSQFFSDYIYRALFDPLSISETPKPTATTLTPFPEHSSLLRWMSGTRPPATSSQPPEPIMHSMKRQLPFSSMKPPFVAPGDYHRFAPDHRRASDQEAEVIVVKTPVRILFLFLFLKCSSVRLYCSNLVDGIFFKFLSGFLVFCLIDYVEIC